MSFRIRNEYVSPLIKSGDKESQRKTVENSKVFQDILDGSMQKANQEIKISGHASKRLTERNIRLNNRDLKNLGEAMDKAKEKGAKESLMLYKDMAFIASIKNRTLVTAIDFKNSREKIFTNIDSAVIVD